VFSAHDDMYEHSFADGVHYFDVGIGGDGLRAPYPGQFNDKQIFVADDHAPERWRGNVLVEGGKHYGHIEMNVQRKAEGAGFTVTITPVYLFPILAPDAPGTVTGWERREYDDVLRFDAVGPAAVTPAAPEAAHPPAKQQR
jgi:hypothetical protein